MSRFGSIKRQIDEEPAPALPSPTSAPPIEPVKYPARQGKRAVSGYFSVELSRALNLLAVERDISLQAVMGEAFDEVLRKYGKHPFGER